MKKLMLFLIIASAFAGCGKQQEGNKTEGTPAVAETKTEATQANTNTAQQNEWGEDGINSKTGTIFNEAGDTKYLKIAEVDNIFKDNSSNKEFSEIGVIEASKDKKEMIWRTFYGNKFATSKYEELQKLVTDKKGDAEAIKNFDSSFNNNPIYLDILVADTQGQKPNGILTFTFFTKEMIKKVDDITLKIGNDTLVLKENEIMASKGFENGSSIICNSIAANLSPEVFEKLSKLKNNDKVSITFKADGKDLVYEYTYQAETNKLYAPLMKYNQLNK